MPVATPPDAPDRAREGNRPPAPAELDGVAGMLARSLQTQTDALVAEVRALGVRFDAGIGDMRAEARSTRYWFVGALVLAILVLGGVVGVRTGLDVPGVGSVVSGPAAPPPGAP